MPSRQIPQSEHSNILRYQRLVSKCFLMNYRLVDDSEFEGDSTRPERSTQEELSDLIRNLNLPKDSFELSAD